MSKELDLIKDQIIFNAGQIAMKMRLNKSMGQLYAALYLSDEPISLVDLAKICRMSKGNASINIRHLERWNAVHKTYSNGNRKDYYLANKDVMGFVIKRGAELFSDILNRGGGVLNNASMKMEKIDAESISPEQRVIIGKYKNKLDELSNIFAKLKKIADNMDKLETIMQAII